jgi:hypothetical protein
MPMTSSTFRARTVFGLCMSALSLAEVGGNVTALVAFNFWMRSFEYGSATATINFLCAFFYVAVFAPLAVFACVHYVFTARCGRRVALARLRMFLRPRHIVNGLLIALADSWINIATTYAAGRTTVLTQIFAKSTEPVMTFVLAFVVLRDHRGLKDRPSWLPIISFIFVGAAVVMHMIEDLEKHKHNEKATAFFIVLYLTGVFGSSCYAIAQARFIRIATEDFEVMLSTSSTLSIADGTMSGSASTDGSVVMATAAAAVPMMAVTATEDGDGRIPRQVIRSMALVMDLSFTLLITILVVPLLEIIPNFGSSSSYAAVFTNLQEGFRCVVSCPNNFWYTAITCGGWTLVYFADTFMNHFSPTLNAMVNEFTSPTGVIVMLIFPVLALGSNPSDSERSIFLNVFSVVSLVIGVGLFAKYEASNANRFEAIMPERSAAVMRCEAEAIAADLLQLEQSDSASTTSLQAPLMHTPGAVDAAAV